MSWSRRIGVAAALLLLVGGSIAFASQTWDKRADKPNGPAANAPAPPAPALLAPAAALTREATVDLTLIPPTGLRRDQTYRIRIYVNGEVARERPLLAGDTATVDRVPLVEGDNAIRAVLIGSAGEGDASADVHVTRDSSAPLIRVSDPPPGSTVYGADVLLRGRTEPGADMTVIEQPGGRVVDVSVDAGGRFLASLVLAAGSNQYLLRSQDPAGNQARVRVTFVRAESAARLSLDISAEEFEASELPTQLDLVASVRDELGRPLDGIAVTFSLSPPNQTTTTYRTTTVAGVARWPDLEIVDDGSARGTWLVTVLAVLPSGAELRENRTFSVH